MIMSFVGHFFEVNIGTGAVRGGIIPAATAGFNARAHCLDS